MKYRSGTKIVATILDAANGGESKTKIMYKAYLFSTIKNIFVLIKDNILEYIDRTHKFKTIDKGCNNFKKIKKLKNNITLT